MAWPNGPQRFHGEAGEEELMCSNPETSDSIFDTVNVASAELVMSIPVQNGRRGAQSLQTLQVNGNARRICDAHAVSHPLKAQTWACGGLQIRLGEWISLVPDRGVSKASKVLP